MRTYVSLYHRHRFPVEIISHCVCLYFRFPLSFRDVQEMLAMRECPSVMRPSENGASSSARPTQMRCACRKSSRPGDHWHLDEVFLKINGRLHYLWRAVDPDGDVLDILVQSSRDKKAAKKFFRKLLKRWRYVPRVIITDKLRSYSSARVDVMPGVEHLQNKYQNNRAENSHQPTRLRERVMRKFKSAGHAQRFLSAFGIITAHFRVARHLYKASSYRAVMKLRFADWRDAICAEAIVK